MSTANPSRLSLHEINANLKDKSSGSMLKILNATSSNDSPIQMITPLNMNQTPIVSQSPAISTLSYLPRRQVVSAAPSQHRQSYVPDHQANNTTQLLNDQSSALYAESPIPSPHQHHQSVAKLFQLNESDPGSPVNESVEHHNGVSSYHHNGVSITQSILATQQGTPTIAQSIGAQSSAAPHHYSSSTPYEGLLPHHHEQIREQLKILPPPQYSSRPPVIIEPQSGSASQVVAQAAHQSSQLVAAASASHHSSTHHLTESHHSHHSQVAQVLEQSHSAHSEVAEQPAHPQPPQQLRPQPQQPYRVLQQHSAYPVISQRDPNYIPRIQRIPFDPSVPLDVPGSIPFTPQLIIDGVSTQRQGRYKDQYEQYKVRQYDVYYITIKGPIENMQLEPCLQNNEFKVLVN